MADWAGIWRVPEEERLAFYYQCARSEGMKIDWQSGRIWREE
jgi:hypothetical protein